MQYDMTEVRQKRIQSFAFVIAASVCVLFSVVFAVSSLVWSGDASGGCEIKLEGRINPNDAPVASLVRLPGIGIVRAGAIVAYRTNLADPEGQSRAFESVDDLQKVKGIGPKTAESIRGWLKF